ncbi:MAG: hypothetical protein QW303_07480, partial [Nitrososphaerota archaeon]
MHRSKEIILNGLKNLEKLEKSFYSVKRSTLRRNNRSTLKLEQPNCSNFSYDSENVFDENNVSLINTFPNAILLEDSIFNMRKKGECQEKLEQQGDNKFREESIPMDRYKKIANCPLTYSDNCKEDIWDILDKLRRENGSESLDTLTSESEGSWKNEMDICKSCNSIKSFIEDQHTGLVVCSKCGA